jgi:hypothetical protein
VKVCLTVYQLSDLTRLFCQFTVTPGHIGRLGTFGNNTITVLGRSQLTTIDLQICWSIGHPTYIVYLSIPLSSFLHLDKALLYPVKYLMVVDLAISSCLYMAGYSQSHPSTLPVMAAIAIESCQYIASCG